jgi:hypothetical protein
VKDWLSVAILVHDVVAKALERPSAACGVAVSAEVSPPPPHPDIARQANACDTAKAVRFNEYFISNDLFFTTQQRAVLSTTSKPPSTKQVRA